MTSGDDWGVWKWVAGAVGALISGVFAGTWAAATKTSDFEARLKVLENARATHDARCEKQKSDLVETIRKEVCSIVKLAIKDSIIDNTKTIGDINGSIRVLATMQEEIQKDISDIFSRLSKRDSDRSNGQERRA